MKRSTNIFIAMLCVLLTSQAFGHGYFTNGRAKLCADGKNLACGAVQFEPQSVEGPGGFPQAGPRDGEIASGGSRAWQELNEQTADRWEKVDFRAGSNTFRWKLTAPHRTSDWQYFITRQNWNPNQPLTRDSFVLEPFCVVDDNNQVPPVDVAHQCDVPARTGYHVIFGAWNIGDTDQSFYQIIDAQFAAAPRPTELEISGVSVDENDTTANVTVTLNADAVDPVSVSIASADGSANQGSDYYGFFQILEFEPGQNKIEVPVVLIDDQSAEADEQFTVRLFNASGATIVNDKAVVTIKDQDVGTATFSVAASDVTEGELALITVTLSQAQPHASSVMIASAPITADRGTDYYGIFQVLEFAAGETEKTVNVETLDDQQAEKTETLQVRLFSSAGADISLNTASVDIADND